MSGTTVNIRSGKMPEEPPKSSPIPSGEPPNATSKSTEPGTTFTDGRPQWEWRSRYPGSAWLQVIGEGAYLAIVLLVSLGILGWAAFGMLTDTLTTLSPSLVGPAQTTFLTWAAVGLGGVCGGCCFALKWLYHGVAYGKWHRDRVVWRVVVPLLSGVIALFTGLMIASGFLPILNRTVFGDPKIGVAFGFFVGFFSDNLIAGLQRIANQVFGTLEAPKRGGDN